MFYIILSSKRRRWYNGSKQYTNTLYKYIILIKYIVFIVAERRVCRIILLVYKVNISLVRMLAWVAKRKDLSFHLKLMEFIKNRL